LRHGFVCRLQNDIEQIPELVQYFDFAVNEQCFQYNECDKYQFFTSSNKVRLLRPKIG
jgi:hypothetical protein